MMTTKLKDCWVLLITFSPEERLFHDTLPSFARPGFLALAVIPNASLEGGSPGLVLRKAATVRSWLWMMWVEVVADGREAAARRSL